MIGILAALPSLIQTIAGGAQLLGGARRLNNLERPQYEIPQEAASALTLAAQRAGDPESLAITNARRQSNLNFANAINAARLSGGGSAAAPALLAQANMQTNQIAAQQDQYRQAMEGQYMDQLGQMAQRRDMQFQMNEFAPYAQTYNEGREMVGGGLENLYAGIGGLSSLGQLLAAGSASGAGANAASKVSGNKAITETMDLGNGNKITQTTTTNRLPRNNGQMINGLSDLWRKLLHKY